MRGGKRKADEAGAVARLHQLRLLRGQRLVKYRKEGKIAYYSLDDNHIRNLMSECARHVSAD